MGQVSQLIRQIIQINSNLQLIKEKTDINSLKKQLNELNNFKLIFNEVKITLPEIKNLFDRYDSMNNKSNSFNQFNQLFLQLENYLYPKTGFLFFKKKGDLTLELEELINNPNFNPNQNSGINKRLVSGFVALAFIAQLLSPIAANASNLDTSSNNQVKQEQQLKQVDSVSGFVNLLSYEIANGLGSSGFTSGLTQEGFNHILKVLNFNLGTSQEITSGQLGIYFVDYMKNHLGKTLPEIINLSNTGNLDQMSSLKSNLGQITEAQKLSQTNSNGYEDIVNQKSNNLSDYENYYTQEFNDFKSDISVLSQLYKEGKIKDSNVIMDLGREGLKLIKSVKANQDSNLEKSKSELVKFLNNRNKATQMIVKNQ